MAPKKGAARKNQKALATRPRAPVGNGKKNRGEVQDYATAYRAALMNPFSARAQGARVPDMYSAPTVPKHITQSYTLSTTAGALPAQILILPNLYMPVICPAGALGGAQTWVTMDGQSTGTCVINSTSVVSSQLTNYRIVGYGVRIYSTGAITSTSGRVLVATNPVSSWINHKPATIGGQATTNNNATASVSNTLQAYGMPVSWVGSQYFVNSGAMPGDRKSVV